MIKRGILNSTILAIVLCGSLSGCGQRGVPGTLTARTTRAASELVTLDDAQRMLGDAARLGSDRTGASDSMPGGSERTCEYVGADRATFNVVIVRAPSEEAARSAYEQSRAGLGSFEHVDDVSDIGDQAFLSQGPRTQKLEVRTKAFVMLLDVRVPTQGEATATELRRIAARVVSQL